MLAENDLRAAKTIGKAEGDDDAIERFQLGLVGLRHWEELKLQ